MEQINISSIIVDGRFRQDMGDIDGLAKSIDELGQLQPIIINRDRRLIAGGRRLAAMKMLGRDFISASVFDLDDIDALKVERDENDQRKAPTVSERVALAAAIEERLGKRQGQRTDIATSGNVSLSDQGRTADIAAAKAGLGSGKTLEAAKRVVERGSPELVAAMDAGRVTIHAAKDLSTLPDDELDAINFAEASEVKKARGKASARERRASGKDAGSKKAAKPAPPHAAGASGVFAEGSGLSAWVLAARATNAISQISRSDPNAANAIESICLALEQQQAIITGDKCREN